MFFDLIGDGCGPNRFNGATLRREWNVDIEEITSRGQASASMEPLSGESGMKQRRLHGPRAILSFNGATLRREWNATNHGSLTLNSQELRLRAVG